MTHDHFRQSTSQQELMLGGSFSVAERDLWTLQLPPEQGVAEEPELETALFAYLEAVHRLTMGVPAAWADLIAVGRAFAVLMGEGDRWMRHRAQRHGLVETLTINRNGDQARIGDKGTRVLVRLSATGAAEHLAMRPMALPALLEAAR